MANATNKNLPNASAIPKDPNDKLGIYNFIDEYGNLTQIKKKKLTRDVYKQAPLEAIESDIYVIGVNSVDPMGCGDDTPAYAIY